MRRLGRGISLLAFVCACYEPGPQPPVEVQALLKWRNADVRGESIPVVDGSAVYHLEQETHILSAVRKSDGSLIWQRTLPVTNPNFDGYGLALSGGVLVVGDLDLFGIDSATGAILWQFHPTEGANPGFGRLTVADGVVYCGSTSGHLFAVDAVTGAQKWAARAMPSTSSIFNPRVVDGIVYAGFTDFPPQQTGLRGGAVALNASTGTVIWTLFAPVPASNPSTENTEGVAVLGDKAFFGSSTGIHVVDRATGTLLSTLGASFFGDAPLTPHRPFAIGPLLLVGSGQPSQVTAIDPATLERKWQQATTSSVSSISGDSQVAYLPQMGVLVAVTMSTGLPKWTFRSTSVGEPFESFLAAPAFDNSMVYLPGSKSVYAFKRE